MIIFFCLLVPRAVFAMQERAENNAQEHTLTEGNSIIFEYVQSALNALEDKNAKLNVRESDGYCYIENRKEEKAFFRGSGGIYSLREYIEVSCYNHLHDNKDGALTDLRKELAENYKIHLMPKTKEWLKTIIYQLLINTVIRENIELFKVLSPYGSFDDFWQHSAYYLQKNDEEYRRGIPAIVVIYPAQGREKAQKTLEVIYSLFGTMPGVGLDPRFNEKVTDAIYYAQGDGDDKIETEELEPNSPAYCKEHAPELFSTLFPNPIFNKKKTLYHPHFVDAQTEQDYRLIINMPEKKIIKARKKHKKRENRCLTM